MVELDYLQSEERRKTRLDNEAEFYRLQWSELGIWHVSLVEIIVASVVYFHRLHKLLLPKLRNGGSLICSPRRLL